MDFGQNIFNWIQEQFFYLGMTAIIVIVAICIFQKASVKMISMVVLGGIGLAIITAPEELGNLGQLLWSTIFG